jgi:hypothetical protein
MIPAIGIMVGFYIITRMLDDILIGKKNGKSSSLVQILAALSVLAALYGLFTLVTTGFDISSLQL